MPSMVNSKFESDFVIVAPGSYVARCYSVVNIGKQTAGPYEPKNRHWIAFEIPSERIAYKDKDGFDQEGPAVIGARYTSSLSPKATLRQHLETWRGQAFSDEQLKNFDLFNLVGVPAMISVVHSNNGKYANITSVIRLPQGMVCPDAELPTIAYDPTDPGAEVAFEKLSSRLRETVLKGHAKNEPAPVVPSPEERADPNATHLVLPRTPQEAFNRSAPF